MKDLKEAIAQYEQTKEGPYWHVDKIIDAADTLAEAAEAHLAAQEDDDGNNEDGLSADQPPKPVDQLAVMREALEKAREPILAYLDAPELVGVGEFKTALRLINSALDKVKGGH